MSNPTLYQQAQNLVKNQPGMNIRDALKVVTNNRVTPEVGNQIDTIRAGYIAPGSTREAVFAPRRPTADVRDASGRITQFGSGQAPMTSHQIATESLSKMGYGPPGSAATGGLLGSSNPGTAIGTPVRMERGSQAPNPGPGQPGPGNPPAYNPAPPGNPAQSPTTSAPTPYPTQQPARPSNGQVDMLSGSQFSGTNFSGAIFDPLGLFDTLFG
jgi:hypothetical protein